ncbi:MAG: XrtB/PEP-CTERM-associated polysaccharide biosynthesis outer membrane protein EpsL [Nitrosospira sp.]
MPLLNLSRYYSHWLAIAVLLLLALAAQHAAAAPGDTLNLSAGSTFMYDSNVFRLAPSIDLAPLVGQSTKSDLIITSTAAMNVNKVYSMQRFDFNGSIVDNRYHNFEFLNFIGKNYTAAWHWFLTPYLHGTLSSGHREALNNFSNLTGFINSANRNIRTDDNYRFDAVFELTRSWHVVGGVSHTTVKNSRLTVQDFDNKVLSAEGGIRYVLPSGTTLTYKVRSGDGSFFKRPEPIASRLFDTRFNDMEHSLQLIWPVSGKTSIEARIGHLSRKHDHFPQRDFSGIIGNVDFNWFVTGKTRITATWARELGNMQTAVDFQLPQFQLFSSSYIASNRFSLTPVWQITSKTALRLRYDFLDRDFRGAVIALPGDSRSDTQHSGMVAFDWQPVDALFLSAMLQRDHRSSNLGTYEFDNTAASVTARLNF